VVRGVSSGSIYSMAEATSNAFGEPFIIGDKLQTVNQRVPKFRLV